MNTPVAKATLGIDAADVDAILAYVRDAPVCGSLGDKVLGMLTAAAPSEFSVSFVSMAAAILAFTRLLQARGFGGIAPERTTMSSVAFRNLSSFDDDLAWDAKCPVLSAHGSGIINSFLCAAMRLNLPCSGKGASVLL